MLWEWKWRKVSFRVPPATLAGLFGSQGGRNWETEEKGRKLFFFFFDVRVGEKERGFFLYELRKRHRLSFEFFFEFSHFLSFHPFLAFLSLLYPRLFILLAESRMLKEAVGSVCVFFPFFVCVCVCVFIFASSPLCSRQGWARVGSRARLFSSCRSVGHWSPSWTVSPFVPRTPCYCYLCPLIFVVVNISAPICYSSSTEFAGRVKLPAKKKRNSFFVVVVVTTST